MSYQIVYGPQKGNRSGKHRMIRYIWIGILVLVVVTACFGSVRHEILALLIPGDPEITMAAWEELVSRLQTGGGVADAVTAFCRQVLEGAGVAG